MTVKTYFTILFAAVIMGVSPVHAGEKMEKPAKKTQIVSGVLESGIPAVIHTPDTIVMKNTTGENSVKSLFDDDAKSQWLYWYSQKDEQAFDTGNDYTTLLVTLNSNVIVTGIRLRLCSDPRYVKPKELYIEAENMNAEGYPLEAFYPVDKDKITQTIKLPDSDKYDWDNLVPTKHVMIHVTDIYGDNNDSAIGCLAGIDLTYTKPKFAQYKPKYTWDELKKIILAHAQYNSMNGKWDSPAMKKDLVTYEFMYYLMKRNADAKKLFDKYMPSGAADSEMFSTYWVPVVNELFQDQKKRL